MTDAGTAIWCETCIRLAPLDEWRRKLRQTRVADDRSIVGYISVYEHRTCRAFTAIPVQRGLEAD